MKQRDLINVIKLRVSVGYLGEAHQHSWWTCLFFSDISADFLDPVFSKTAFLARYYGVKEAATIIHDEHIGIGKNVYHLFRLPESLERGMHELLGDDEVKKAVQTVTQSGETANEFLESFALKTKEEDIGPIRIGSPEDIDKPKIWQIAAYHYNRAFQSGIKTYPYLQKIHEQ